MGKGYNISRNGKVERKSKAVIYYTHSTDPWGKIAVCLLGKKVITWDKKLT